MKQGVDSLRLLTQQPARHTSPTVKARALGYLIFARPDLDLAERFLLDFGLQTAHREADRLYMRGTGTTPYCYRIEHAKQARFLGFALEVASHDDQKNWRICRVLQLSNRWRGLAAGNEFA